MKFLELAYQVLKENAKPMTAKEVWAYAVEKRYDKQLDSVGKTPRRTLGARLYTSAVDPRNEKFESIGSNPKRFYLPGITPPNTLKEESLPEPKEDKLKYSEKDLHQVLAYYIRNYMDSFPKTINHATSSKREYGEWVHPDMVACYFPVRHWKSDVYELSQHLGDAQIAFFSFELKLQLSSGNLRKSFFQAVSNSSWAHQGFLVAPEIDDSPDFQYELGRLSKSFGIGIIKLDLEDPDNTHEMFPAEEKDFVDWDTLDKLMMNGDFKKLMKQIKDDITIKGVTEERYDKIQEVEKLIEFFKKRI